MTIRQRAEEAAAEGRTMKCMHGNEGATISSPDYGNGAGVVCFCHGRRTEVDSLTMENKAEVDEASRASLALSRSNAAAGEEEK